MSTADRQVEHERLEAELERIRRAFLQIARMARRIAITFPAREVDVELARLHEERRRLGFRYRDVLGRMEALQSAA